MGAGSSGGQWHRQMSSSAEDMDSGTGGGEEHSRYHAVNVADGEATSALTGQSGKDIQWMGLWIQTGRSRNQTG